MTLRTLAPRIAPAGLAVVVTALGACASAGPDRPVEASSAAGDPLSAWRDTAVKRSVLDFLAEATREGSSAYIPPGDRLATFDLDGTLAPEKPDYMEVMVAMSRLCELADGEPALAAEDLYRAACDGDLERLDADVDTTLLKAFAGETQDFYVDYVVEFLRSRHHPRFDRPYAQLYYLPMRQLIDLLRAEGFAVYLVSGSQQGFTRGFGTGALGIAAPRAIGNTVQLDFSVADGTPVLSRQEAFLPPTPDGKGKAEIIRNRIGLQPVFAFGNTMGDFEMLQSATSGRHPGLGLILVHDDPREYVYRDQKLMDHARRFGWLAVSMKNDFEVVFPE